MLALSTTSGPGEVSTTTR